MTLDEAIKHVEEVAEEQKKEAKEWHENQVRKCELIPFAEMDYTHENECNECAEEHRQLAEWLKDYKRLLEQEPTTKNDLEVVCISRADAIKAMQNKAKKLKNEDTINGLCGAVAILYDIPPVTPQQKTGYWVEETVNGGGRKVFCSECGCPPPFEHISTGDVYSSNGYGVINKTKFCPNCGIRMIEPLERMKNETV